MRIQRPTVIAVRYRDLPRMENGKEECGFTIYRGIVVRWDEDYDTRILDFIDDMKPEHAMELMAVQEHEGSIAFRWKSYIPDGFEEGQGVEVRNDYWSICESTIIDT